MYDAITISRGYRKEKWGYFLRAESFYNVATQEEEYADISHTSAKYHEMSHGESFLALAQNNLGAQFCIVTHSPILLGDPDADIYSFDNGRIHLREYEETESYQVTEMFKNNRFVLLDKLFKGDSL